MTKPRLFSSQNRVTLGNTVLVLGGNMAHFKSFLALTIFLSTSTTSTLAKGNDPNHLLTCKKLEYILIHHPANAIRPYCNMAEIKCRALVMVEERPKKDVLRQEVETRLKEELRYELDICEIALRRLDPEFLMDR